jgi:hypothetical protein
LENAIKVLRRIEGRPGIASEDTSYRTVLDEIGTEIGIKFTNSAEVISYFNQFKNTMKEGGHSDVSDANLQSTGVIPAGVTFDHKFALPNITRAGAGLLLTAWHHKMILNPVIGGLAARGCGGYITSIYKVQRRVGFTWVDDCTMTSAPDVGLTFSDDRQSEVRRVIDEWAATNASQFDFSYEALLKVIRGSDTKGAANG